MILASAALGLWVANASAQERLPYVEKSVWTTTYVQTMPGKFDTYIEDLSKVWLMYVKRLKADGHILSYRILRVEFTRDNEPNLVLMTEYKNMAAFDVGTEYWEKLLQEVTGSLDKANRASASREELRKLRGTLLLRELDFVEK